jgi:cbb3-type cytochrome oxidase subunit 3
MNLFSTVLAAGTGVELTPANVGGNLVTTATVPSIVSYAISVIFLIAAVIFFFMLLIGGLKWILSGGDKAQTESARSQITAALIGLVIVFGAYAITRLLNTIFGIDVLNIAGTLPVL